jgi:DNA invertase Pin-like site-specific DNA recombinase
VKLATQVAGRDATPCGGPADSAMARAKAEGKAIGRPSLTADTREKIASRLATGASAYRVAKELGIDRHTVRKYASVGAIHEG